MTAGKGIVHEEALQGDPETGMLEGFQIWVNLPARDKFVAPYFDGLSADQLPLIPQPEGGRIRVVAGQLGDVQSPVSTYSPLFLFHLDLPAGSRVSLPIDAAHEVGIYLAGGTLHVQETETLTAAQMAVFAATEGDLQLTAQADTQALVLGGLPLGEPMVSYGPFVMNSMQQIEGVVRAYQAGEMGTLPR